MTKNPTKADTFDVWGHPPKTLTKGLTLVQINALKRYTDKVTKKCYRLAYDCGMADGLTVGKGISNALKLHRLSK